MIGKGSPSPHKEASITSSPLPPVDPGYSTVGSMVPTPTPPKVHGYSKLGPKTTKKSKKPSHGYSMVHPHSTVDGVVVEDTDATSEKVPSPNSKEKNGAGNEEGVKKREVDGKTSSESSEMSRYM